jgi:arsenate reductase
MQSSPSVNLYFNPRCSKCRGARDILQAHGIEPHLVRYLDSAPNREDLERVMSLLGIDDPRQMMRTNEPVYAQLQLADANRDRLLDAMVEHPILIERPIVIRGNRAVIARPPERVLELLDHGAQ